MGLRLDRQHPSMHLFRRKARSPSPTPSIEVPRLCLPRQKATTEAPSDDDDMPAATSTQKSSSAMTARLKVPSVGRVRSSSFDSSSMMGEKASTLQLPPMSSQRSKSLDASYGAGSTSEETASDRDSTASLRIPVMARYYRRRSTDIPRLCIHCVHIESLSSQEPSPASSDGEFLFSCGDSTASGDLSSSFDSLDEEDEIDHDSDRSPLQSCGSSDGADGTENGTGVTTLAVPLVKLRSSSFDSSCMVDSPVLAAVEHERRGSLDMLHVPPHGRSSSVDVNLPTCTSNRYRAMTFIPKRVKKAISKSTQDSSNLLHPSHAEYGYQKRELRSSVDWTEAAVNGDHMWTDTSASGDFCYVGEGSCSRTGQRKKCAACKILIHTGCLAELERIKVFKCKSTFREAGPRNYRENTSMRHHWVHRRRQEGKCKQCCKSFQQRFTFQSKEIIAISCSWCKVAYHNKVSCFMMQQIEETCSLGVHAGIIIPPSWIIKLPRKGSFKSSLRKKKRSTVKKRKSTDHKPFIIKPIPSPHMKPLLVFINPKSGGNQGAKLLHKFQWLLNPRQVFDLSQGGPVMALELFKKVPNLRILACGGDGTAGWILSTIDALGITPTPPMAVLPLGTGNDLARTLNWGGGYTDEPISKILCSVEEGPVVELDRWNMKCEPNPQTEPDAVEQEAGEKKLPLEIMNNYFSLGADANVTLEFHESREANPEKFNSRFKNKMFYAGAGGKDLLKRSWKNLADHITIECDGKDLTTKIKELKVHCLVFLNIPRYAAGTQPWGTPSVNNTSFDPQKHDDGLLEVIGFTMTALATLQVGGHGLRLAQCQTVRLTTTKTIPMQVDGEPCKLAPSVVSISLRNRANVIKKPKHRGSVAIGIDSTTVSQEVDIRLISMTDYEAHHYEKEKLKEASKPLNVHVETGWELEQVRNYINRLKVAGSEETQKPPAGLIQNLSTNWCFVDSTTAERFFRIDRAQENIHYVTDITSEDLYILDTDLKASFLQNGCDQDPHPTPQTSHSTVIIQECDDPREVRTRYNMPMTPPRSPGMTTPPPSRQQVNEQAPPLEPAISSEAETPHCVLSTTQQCCVDSEAEKPYCILSTTQPCPVDSEAETPHCILSTSCVELSPIIFIEDAKEKSDYLNEKLMAASAEGNLPRVKELHARGASLMSVDGNGMTALHHAAKLGRLDVVEYLIKNAPRELLDMIDREHGETALLKAACSQRRQICGVLVKAGASASKADHKGNTPRQQALNAKDNELATYLKEVEKFEQVIAQDKETAV